MRVMRIFLEVDEPRIEGKTHSPLARLLVPYPRRWCTNNILCRRFLKNGFHLGKELNFNLYDRGERVSTVIIIFLPFIDRVCSI